MIQTQLKQFGYCQFVPEIDCDSEELKTLHREFDRLEHDPYAPDKVKRFRRYGNGIILPWTEQTDIHWIPTAEDDHGARLSGYDQGGNNPEHPDIRYFRALSEEAKATDFLGDLIRKDFSHTFWSEADRRAPIYFGVHFVKLRSGSASDLGISSPDCFHQDGEPFTFAHLMRRTSGTAGGTNYIGTVQARGLGLHEVPKEDVIAEFELSRFMESFVVHDPRVSHYVTPIRSKENGSGDGERCVILIDFSRMRQSI
ncbi:2OG-Fe dioxygenase family protein [Paracidovorax valerianellae]|uniref:2OG-Fe dioxygenase n=1 Tax=Paracidovorax valerianellae TaxID=187868 RepID=A0A1G6PV41_9BURK|nr:2OG-Fe dioxygenase family protein [Paracidovorax valerianellae]MDA8444972.1 2OG-Fe dioxygenase family protein [Paracidovorax valerianellae]SDC83225.1 2OG-Fe dioxygenase [Paracidovorax valerianellae]